MKIHIYTDAGRPDREAHRRGRDEQAQGAGGTRRRPGPGGEQEPLHDSHRGLASLS